MPVLVALALRLNEVANHGWDVRVALDPGAEVAPETAALLLELFAGPLAFVLGFSAHAGEVSEPVRLAVPGRGIVVDGTVSVGGRSATRRRRCAVPRCGRPPAERSVEGAVRRGGRRRGQRDAGRPAPGLPGY